MERDDSNIAIGLELHTFVDPLSLSWANAMCSPKMHVTTTRGSLKYIVSFQR